MQPAHRAHCGVRASRQWPCFFTWQAESRYPQSQCPQRAGSQGLDMDTRPGPQGDRALPVRIQPTDTTPLMETHPRHTVGTKSSIGERRGLTLSFSSRSVQKDQKQLLSVWLCKISKSVLIELRKTMPAQPLSLGINSESATLHLRITASFVWALTNPILQTTLY
ncbi:hypothetical protein JB92DRAFT_3099599 [Gautieria morchelliformis]|nr:hypothetical protein JB92DRAFT_3099599 [Gautieria morchelliformis]